VISHLMFQIALDRRHVLKFGKDPSRDRRDYPSRKKRE